nr:MAG TPA: tail protein [Caudoviricetes sp.]
MNINQEVRLNLSAVGIPPRLSMPQGDANSRTIVATLWDGATPYSVPASAAVMVRFRKPDGTGGLYDATEAGAAVTASGNTVTAPVATQMLAVAGVVQAEIDIYGTGSGKAADRLATFRFAVEVAPSVYPDAQIISSDYYNIVADDIAKAVSAAANAEEAEKGAVAAKTAAEGYATEANAAKVVAVNAKTDAQTAKTAAEAAKGAAEDSAEDAEAWAVGQRNGVDVPSTDPAYHNNAKYYKDQAQNITGGEFVSYGDPQTLTATQQAQARENINALGGNDDVAKESTSQLILSTLRGQRPKRYGFRIKNSEPNPSTRVEYLYDAEGMTPASMNFSTGVFNYGSWADIWFVRDNHPCMLKSDGTVDYWLKDDDYTQKYTDGSASDVSNTDYGGNCFSAIPLIWVKRYQEGDYSYTVFCEERYDDGYFAYAHTDAQGRIMPYLFYPAFRGSLVDGKLRSIKGQAQDNNTTTTAERTAAQANGNGYDILQWGDWQLLMDMCYLVGKSTNLQATFGQGHTEGGTSAADLLTTGTLSDKGRFYGYADTANAVKVFHTEVCWGDRRERIIGCLQDHGVWKMKMTPEGSGYNLTGAGYEAVGATIQQTGEDAVFGGLFKAARNTPQGLLPTALGGSSATYYCDQHYINVGVLSVPAVGGTYKDGAWCGRYVYVSSLAGSTGKILGASLSFKRAS